MRTTAEEPYLTKNPVTVLVAGFFDAHSDAHVHPRQVPSASSPLRGYLRLLRGSELTKVVPWGILVGMRDKLGHMYVVEGDPREGGDVRCLYCDCRPSGRYAGEPCESVYDPRNITVTKNFT